MRLGFGYRSAGGLGQERRREEQCRGQNGGGTHCQAFVREMSAGCEQFRCGPEGGSSSARCRSTALATVATVVLLQAVRLVARRPDILRVVAVLAIRRAEVVPVIHPAAVRHLAIRRAVVAIRLATADRRKARLVTARHKVTHPLACPARRLPRSRTR